MAMNPDLTLEDRVRRLEEIEEIRRLKLTYAALCDDSYRPEALAGLFTPDGVWDGGDSYGVYRGREEIAGYWRGCADSIPFAIHLILNHIVDIVAPASAATGTCHLLQPMTLNGQATWAAVRYDEKYVVHDGEWRFAESRLTTLLLAPHASGW
jgi:uncharacterized protein (TIGR02246 family)